MKIAIVWFRQDFRLKDHPALFASSCYDAVIPLFIWSPKDEDDWPLGGASKWWLHHSLKALEEEFAKIGLRLIIRVGSAKKILQEVIKETNAEAVFWNRRYEPYSLQLDSKIKSELQAQNVEVQTFNGRLLHEPWEIANKQKKPFQVFTPFWKVCLSKDAPKEPLPIPKLNPYTKKLASEKLERLELLPKIPWDEGIKNNWHPGCVEAEIVAKNFIKNSIANYAELRDRPDIPTGVSHLSPFLHFGEITPKMIWHQIIASFGNPVANEGALAFLRQLGWREFAYHLLYHFPKTPTESLKKSFAHFPWKYNKKALHAWQKGLTGYPFVDAGMRALWKTGWMHNRVRLIVGSFLVKDLRLSWLEGEKWFWDTLVDADLANNCLGWQWVAGCGADAAPYFRIFNPITQGEKFDPEGTYVRKWVPELAKLPSKWIHRPWEAPSDILTNAKVKLGVTYPFPIVNHNQAREEALAAFASLK